MNAIQQAHERGPHRRSEREPTYNVVRYYGKDADLLYLGLTIEELSFARCTLAPGAVIRVEEDEGGHSEEAMKYKAVIPQTGRPIQVFASSEGNIRELARQYLSMLPPGKIATVYKVHEVPILKITSSEGVEPNGKPMIVFQEERIIKNE